MTVAVSAMVMLLADGVGDGGDGGAAIACDSSISASSGSAADCATGCVYGDAGAVDYAHTNGLGKGKYTHAFNYM